MITCDWSSDVCSSDLKRTLAATNTVVISLTESNGWSLPSPERDPRPLEKRERRVSTGHVKTRPEVRCGQESSRKCTKGEYHCSIHLASDYIHTTPSDGLSRVRFYLPEQEHDAPVVICSELPSNDGSSVTYSVHQIAGGHPLLQAQGATRVD
jgi:hypothetical protein